MLKHLEEKLNTTYTENGALTNRSSGSYCLDLFFRAGGMRKASEQDIITLFVKAYAENADEAMKILFFIRDVRGGLGERRFFRIVVKYLSVMEPDSISKNLKYFAEYGRFDDLIFCLDSKICSVEAISLIKKKLDDDVAAMNEGKPASLLAKWLPSINASSKETVGFAKKICRLLKMQEKEYRHTLSSLRKYTDIIENRLRERDYTFDYGKQTSGSMFKYRQAFIRNDGSRYSDYLQKVKRGEAELNASTLYPYEIVRRTFDIDMSEEERLSLDVTWNSLLSHGDNDDNAIAVVDGSGSMYCNYYDGSIVPAYAAIALGIYFAEHNRGVFAGNFITFSMHPELVKIRGADIVEKVRYCKRFNEVANTNIQAVFELILNTAIENNLPDSDMPSKIYIISDMEFDVCIVGGKNVSLFSAMKEEYKKAGYSLPDIVFWNVCSRNENIPVKVNDTGAALVSGNSPAIFDMIQSGEISPIKIMRDIIYSERYSVIFA